MTEAFGSASMVAPLKTVLVCSPTTAGWSAEASRWRELGFLREPDATLADVQFQAFRTVLEGAGAKVMELSPADGLSPDAVYAHDASLVTAHGAVCLRMGKDARSQEPQAHAAWFEAVGIPVLGVLEAPATAEAGDMVWLDEGTLLVGHGFRTNADGILQLQSILQPHGVEVLVAPLPYGKGPDACLHLMTLMSLLDEETVLVDLPWLSVGTMGLLTARGYQRIEIEPDERDTLACNVLALGGKRLLALEENTWTNDRLRTHGFQVATIPGSELCINGGGGPTCLTRPIHRA